MSSLGIAAIRVAVQVFTAERLIRWWRVKGKARFTGRKIFRNSGEYFCLFIQTDHISKAEALTEKKFKWIKEGFAGINQAIGILSCARMQQIILILENQVRSVSNSEQHPYCCPYKHCANVCSITLILMSILTHIQSGCFTKLHLNFCRQFDI